MPPDKTTLPLDPDATRPLDPASTRHDAPATLPASPPPRIHQRYTLRERLGAGGFGEVFRGVDTLTEQPVAIKLMRREAGAARSWREAAMLRALRLPGVVQLIEEGQDGDTAYLVMELVEGEPFPGHAALGDWTKLEGPLRQLLSTLERVHLEGIVHRDLKPHNVLVRADGSVVLLDFGIAVDPELQAPLDAASPQVLGTPAYLAPEQWRGESATRQADLWAVGVMVYEALCGVVPFYHSDLIALMDAVATQPLALDKLPPATPERARALLRALLTRARATRLQSAGDALRLLDGQTRTARALRLEEADSEAALAALCAGHEPILRQRSGAARELWRRAGRDAALRRREIDGWLRAGLARWHGELLALEPDALARLRAGLQVAESTSPAPDDPADQQLLAWARFVQPTLSPALLATLTGLPEDTIRARLPALTQAGYIQHHGDLDPFIHAAPWMQAALPAPHIAHARVAAALPDDHPRKLYHLIAADRADDLAAAQLAQALAWDAQGMVSRALVTLSDAVRLSRAQRREDELPLLLAAARIALASGAKRDLERLLYELESSPHAPQLAQLTGLVQLTVNISQRRDPAWLGALDALGAFEDHELELRRHQWRVRASWMHPLERSEALLDQIAPWAQACHDDHIWGTYLGWLGLLRHKQARYQEAADLHHQSAKLKRRPSARTASLLNAMLAHELALMLPEALADAERAIDAARACEHAHYEIQATLSRRHLLYQLDQAPDPDPALFEVAPLLMDWSNLSGALITEAAIATRAGRRDDALAYTQRAIHVASDGHRASLLLAVCLRHALTHEPPAEMDALLHDLASLSIPRIIAQCLGLLALCAPLSPDALGLLQQHASCVPADHLTTRLDVLSIAEALTHAGLLPDGPRLTLPTTP